MLAVPVLARRADLDLCPEKFRGRVHDQSPDLAAQFEYDRLGANLFRES